MDMLTFAIIGFFATFIFFVAAISAAMYGILVLILKHSNRKHEERMAAIYGY